jgi:hypothetical protein
LKRKDAINLLYKIYNACQDVTINAIQIEGKKTKEGKSRKEFVLVINSDLTPQSRSIVKTIAQNHDLKIKKINNEIILSN